jgi:hypothetical protein
MPKQVIYAVLLVAEQVITRLPVRSALFKQRTGGLVVRWVTTSESPLLYVFAHGSSFFASDETVVRFISSV